MDVAEFDGWLSKIAALTPPQRRQAWQILALSEAADCDDLETGPGSTAAPPAIARRSAADRALPPDRCWQCPRPTAAARVTWPMRSRSRVVVPEWG